MKSISPHNPIFKILFQLFLLLFGILIFMLLIQSMGVLKDYLIYGYTFLGLVLIIGIYKIRLDYLEIHKVYYDDRFLLLKNKASEKIGYNTNLEIAFEEIHSIRRTSGKSSLLGFRIHNYNIGFNKGGREKETFNFSAFALNPEMDEFITLVEKANSEVIISL